MKTRRLLAKAWVRWAIAVSLAILIVILVAGNGLTENGIAGALR